MKEKTIEWFADIFYQYLREKNFSEHTIRNRKCFFKRFIRFSDERGVSYPKDVSQAFIERFMKYLYEHRDPETNECLSLNGQRAVGIAVRCYFKWMKKRGYLKVNPAIEVDLPRAEYKLQLKPLTVEDIENILSLPDVNTVKGIRDRAMLETLYSTGIRRSELASLELYDVDASHGVLLIHQGKGKKDRVVPVSKRALEWIDRYLVDARPAIVQDADNVSLFVSNTGIKMSPKSAGCVITAYIKKADLGRIGSCHLFRHATACLMLENGAGVKCVQEMLGHADLRSTEIYTKVSIRKLKETFEQTHPSAKPVLKQDKIESK